MKHKFSAKICWIPILLLLVSWQGGDQAFRSPVNYPFSLSGSFGEIRLNHFHSGIDIRTDGVEGKPIYAIADGFVARVFVSPGGFGKALYLAHPNGYTSVYGHLKSFAGDIGSWVKTQQYQKESFVIDTEVPVGLLKVRKGDIVAYSGNSGSSAGPHLHFEIRDSKTQGIIDPLKFGLKPADRISPQISWIKIYPSDEYSLVNNENQPLLIPVTGKDGNFSLRLSDSLKLSGNIFFGIETNDQSSGSGFRTGVPSIQLSVDGTIVYSHNIERFLFSETRYVNSLMDYQAYIKTKHKIQRSYIAPNNQLRFYGQVANRGVISFTDRKVHKVQYTLKDVFGNTSRLIFYVQSIPPVNGKQQKKYLQNTSARPSLSCKTSHFIEQQGLQLKIPEGALYEDLDFEYDVSPPIQGAFSNLHHLHNSFTPLHVFCTLSIKPRDLPKSLTSKALIVKMEDGNRKYSKGGKFENGFITTEIREFGKYAVMIDTIPPIIRPVNIFPNKKLVKQSTISLKISDNLSGIKTYRGTLNGKWILMDYDEKNHLLTYTFDHRIQAGKNIFQLSLTDAVGNTSKYEAVLYKN